MNVIRRHISIFSLVVFLASKLLGLHTLAHDIDDKNDTCDICQYVITVNSINYFLNSFELQSTVQYTFFVDNNASYDCGIGALLDQFILDFIKSRPPPIS